MKKAISLLFVLVFTLSALPVSAAAPQPGEFTISGYTTGYDYTTLPSGRTKFDLTAEGEVTGYFAGGFFFEEAGNVDFDPLTGQGSGKGTNQGLMTITGADGSQAVIRFAGQTDSVYVWGSYTLIEGTGLYANVHSQGVYTGTAGFGFSVTFTGDFH